MPVIIGEATTSLVRPRPDLPTATGLSRKRPGQTGKRDWTIRDRWAILADCPVGPDIGSGHVFGTVILPSSPFRSHSAPPMPNSKSAKKRLRQNKTHNARNRSVKSAIRTQVKKVHAALDSGNVESAEKEFVQAARKLDRAGANKVIHKNAAARRKSRLQKRIVAVKRGG